MQGLWVGRTVFNRRAFQACVHDSEQPRTGHGNTCSMADEQDGAPCRSHAAGMNPNPSWTVTELRSFVVELREDLGEDGLSKSVQGTEQHEARGAATRGREDWIGVNKKRTRGILLRQIRDYHSTPAETVMTIGRHRAMPSTRSRSRTPSGHAERRSRTDASTPQEVRTMVSSPHPIETCPRRRGCSSPRSTQRRSHPQIPGQQIQRVATRPASAARTQLRLPGLDRRPAQQRNLRDGPLGCWDDDRTHQ